jgi:glycosyltransferase involved in cell wall biosynthesis
MKKIFKDNLISVIIPTRNRCLRLLDAIASVRTQNLVEFEIIVVDDASIDETYEVMSSLSKEEPRLRYLRNDFPLGGGGARNAGAALAQGEFISFLDDDDIFLPDKLNIQVSALRDNPDAPASTCGFLVYKGEQQISTVIPSWQRIRDELLRANILGGASVCMVRATSFRLVGGFESRLPSCQDWDLWLKLCRLGPIIVINKPLVRYNFHEGGQITGNVMAEYRGRRFIHLRYVGEMSKVSRHSSLTALLYYRWVRLELDKNRRIIGVFALLHFASSGDRLIYLARSFRLIFREYFLR